MSVVDIGAIVRSVTLVSDAEEEQSEQLRVFQCKTGGEVADELNH